MADGLDLTLQSVANLSLAVLLGGVAGGVVSALVVGATWWIDSRARTLRELLLQGLQVHALREAWILEGDGFSKAELALNLNLQIQPKMTGFWLRQVEVRAVLDEAAWNSPKEHCYDFVEGRRAWIVRNTVQADQRSYGAHDDSTGVQAHPALLSSQAMHELCGWVERVASVNRLLFLSRHARHALWPLLVCVSGEDRLAVFGGRLTGRARKFLRWYSRKYAQPNQPLQPSSGARQGA